MNINNMRKIFLLIVLTILTLQICTSQNIRIAAASNLKFVLEEINSQYKKKNPNINFVANYSASGVLFQQISNGAEFDLFISAENAYTKTLEKNKLTKGMIVNYCNGKLVLWNNNINIKEKGIQILKDNSIKKIAIAKPQIAPYGERAIETLKYYNLYNIVSNKLIYAENIAQVIQYVNSGNAEIGFLPLSLAMNNKGSNYYIEIDEKAYSPIEQTCVMLKNAENKKDIEQYFSFLIGNEAKEIFKKFGYKVP